MLSQGEKSNKKFPSVSNYSAEDPLTKILFVLVKKSCPLAWIFEVENPLTIVTGFQAILLFLLFPSFWILVLLVLAFP